MFRSGAVMFLKLSFHKCYLFSRPSQTIYALMQRPSLTIVRSKQRALRNMVTALRWNGVKLEVSVRRFLHKKLSSISSYLLVCGPLAHSSHTSDIPSETLPIYSGRTVTASARGPHPNNYRRTRANFSNAGNTDKIIKSSKENFAQKYYAECPPPIARETETTGHFTATYLK
jgi:hypothetical protein